MLKSELITTQHLARKAMIYVRQSSPHQVLNNQESLELQYALKCRALEFGWPEDHIIIVDNDLGLTGATADHREGFKELLAQVALEKVGIIFSYDVTRLSRNCSDWYPLLDICGYKNCLIADRDGVYDPGSMNGRLLLGLKGQLAEVELSTIRARLTAGLLNKAKRGELALQLPAGLVRDEYKIVQKDPNLEVQAAIDLVFKTFLKVRSASKTVVFFKENNLKIPRYDRWKEVLWKKPTAASVVSILRNPAYAGAFAYGRTQSVRTGPSACDKMQKKVDLENCKILIRDKFPSYVDWEDFEKIQILLKENYAEYNRNKTRGIPRPGAALLQGIVYCGECGHKMVVQYKTRNRYLCNYHRQQYREPVCQFIPSDPMDEFVIQAFFQALSPIELDAYAETLKHQNEANSGVMKASILEVERLRYQAKLSERQFNRVDPDNRLVAATLEERWEQALHNLKAAEEMLEQKQRAVQSSLPPLDEGLRSAFVEVGKKLPEIWNQVSRVHQKSFLRCLIEKVVVHRGSRDCLKVRIVWQGGETTTTDIPITVGSFAELSTKKELERLILERAKAQEADEDIAQELTRLGYRSPMSLSVLPSTVRIIRLKHGIIHKRSQSHPIKIDGFLTVTQLAKKVGVTAHWVYDRLHKGDIETQKVPLPNRLTYLFPDTENTIKMFQDFKNGLFKNLRFSEEYQDA
jgi:DNA invertase Pin-like site-specific DNA recombinase